MKYTNTNGLPASIVDAITTDTYDVNKADPAIVSVTALIGPPKIRQLTLRHWDEIEEDVSENIWRLLGSAVHAVLERAHGADRFIEERLNEVIDGITVTGKTDVYEAKEKVIQDYKVTSSWSIVYNPQGKDEWAAQLNCYAWLFRKAGFEVNGLRVVAILRDWSKTQALKSKDYPQSPIKVVDMPLWSSEATEEYLEERLRLHNNASALLDEEIIPFCTPEERWAKPTTWAVMKQERKTALRVFERKGEADTLAETDKALSVVERKGEDRRCMSYCPVSRWCNYYKSTYPPSVCGANKEE